MATERGDEEEPTCRPQQWHSPKGVKTAGKNLEKVRKTAVLSFFWTHVRKLEASVREGDHAGFYRRLKTMNVEGKRDHNSQFIKDEHSSLLRDVELIRER